MRKYFYFFVIGFILLIIHAIYTNHAIYGDGNGYYSYTQSIYYDRSVNSQEILEHLSNFEGREYTFSRVFWDPDKNPFMIGTAILWLPSMFLMDLFSSDRFDLVHELGPGITGIALTIFGLIFLEKYLKSKFIEKKIHWVILTLFFGSNLFYYSSFEPALSHQPAFFIICLLLYLSLNKNMNYFLMGILTGFLTIIRPADMILIIPVLISIKFKLKHTHLFAFGFLIAILPQLYVQNKFYGSIFSNPYLKGTSGNWSINLNHTLEYLFSPIRGLFVWSPIFMLSLYGLIKKRSYLILGVLTLAVLIHSSWSAYLSAGFGQRFAVSFIPYFSIGLAHIFNKLSQKKIYLIFAASTIWNILLIFGFYLLKLKNAP